MNAEEHPDLQILKLFVKGLSDFMGRGGSRAVAKSIGMQESAFSKLVNDPTRHFDRKTLLSYELMRSTRSEGIQGAKETAVGELGPMIFHEWEMPDGEKRYTWEPKESA